MNNKDLIRKGKLLFSSTGSSELFTSFSKLYPMTSENIKDTYELFDLKDKDILTVTSSGDHILCAALKGAKEIDSFDINYFTEYFYYFKKATILTYDLREFEEKFLYSMIPIGLIKKKWYEEIRENLEGKYKDFWDEIISYVLSNNIPFDKIILAYPISYDLVNYLDNESYNLLKEKLASVKVNFIHSDLLHLDKHLNKTYDYMFLSNIADYIGIFDVKDYVSNKLVNYINDKGEIAYAYMYDAEKKIVKRYEKDNYYPIPSAVLNEEAKDYVLTLKK